MTDAEWQEAATGYPNPGNPTGKISPGVLLSGSTGEVVLLPPTLVIGQTIYGQSHFTDGPRFSENPLGGSADGLPEYEFNGVIFLHGYLTQAK